jgi:glycerol-3-phosphate acyltransferase PlsX
MDYDQITIAVDAMGGDNSPYKSLKGVEIFLSKRPDCKIILFGNKTLIEETINLAKLQLSNLEIVNSIENIENDDSANTILRNKKESSIHNGLQFVKESKLSGFVSAGNTAGIMILSRLKLGMIENIERPAICSVIPNKISHSIMLDLGANVYSNAKNLFQFAVMGYCYHSFFKDNKNPKIAIINIGIENNKGKEFLQEASELIANSFLKDNFIGFLEPDKITSGECDIIISDGYTGNIILKTAEGMSDYITGNLKKIFSKNLINKLAYKILEKDISLFKDNINPEKYNGAMLLGVDGVSIKSHGSASPLAFSFAIENCYQFIKKDINNKIRKQLEFL